MTRIQPFPVPCAEKARAALPRPAGTAVFMLTHEARSALCGRFGLEDSRPAFDPGRRAPGARHAVCTRRPRMAGARLFAGGPSGGRGLRAPSVLCAGAPLRRRGNGPFLFAGPRCARRARTRSRSDGPLAGLLRSPCVALAGDRGPGVCRRMRSWVVTMRPSFLHMSVLRERMLEKDFR